MCGRYNIDFEDEDEYDEILAKVDKKVREKLNPRGLQAIKGDIYPTNYAPILYHKGTHMEADVFRWGFCNTKNKGIIINARQETANEKNMFRNCLEARRCIILSTGFYEWDAQKRKYFFQNKGTKMLYMAGLYNFYENEMRFVILTTKANASMESIHDRMPVILQKDQIKTWLSDTTKARKLIAEQMPLLDVRRMEEPFEQLSFFLRIS